MNTLHGVRQVGAPYKLFGKSCFQQGQRILIEILIVV